MAGYAMTPAVDRYLNLTSYYGQQVRMDTQARVVLPQILRTSGKLDAEVTVRGKMQYLEVDNFKRIEAEVAGNQLTQEDRMTLASIFQRRADN
jgi:MraZ protein